MFLKQLTIKGFKSFAEPVTLDLEPGVCVVVGPNGSGKSNIVDAVAWVLGAQAPRAVRSSKMDDVIFAGTSKKPALGRAEVSLTIDNSDGTLLVDGQDVTEIRITRTLFRSGDSEYAINGQSCRLLDIQEMLSDTGVGRSQHVIVSQGNLDGVLNARPEDRRSIIEEAAGVLKHRRRREKSMRRLESTDADLLRAQDLVREVRRQMKPLQRQADAARRHDGVVEELATLKAFVAGRDLGTMRSRLTASDQVRSDLAAAEHASADGVAVLDAQVVAAEAEVSGVAEVAAAAGLADDLTRAERLRERARGRAGVVTERLRSVQTSLQSQADESVVASLEADGARLAAELAEVEVEAASIAPAREEVAAAESELAAERAHFDVEWGEGDGMAVPGTLTTGAPIDAPVLTAAEVRGELGALRQGVDRTRGQLTRAEARLAALTQRAERLGGERTRLAADVAEATAAEPRLGDEVAASAVARRAAEAALAAAEIALAAAEADRHRWTARHEALAQALDGARARAGAERLAGVDGVVGTLLELVDVDDGWESAFEAACGEAVAAVIVDGSPAARRALHHLGDAAGGGGAVIALPDPGAGVGLPFLPELPGLEAVRTHVRSRLTGLDALLDLLLAHAVCVPGTWEEALDLALDRGDLVVVTRAGDRFAATGWRTGAGGTGATGASLEEAAHAAAAATDAAATARSGLVTARDGASAARQAETDAGRRRQAAVTRRTSGASTLDRMEGEQSDVDAEAAALTGDVAELRARVEREAARVDELGVLLPDLEAEELAGKERDLARRAARRRLEERSASVTGLRKDVDVRAGGLEERRTFLTRKSAEVAERLVRFEAERIDAEARRVRLEAERAELRSLADALEVVGSELEQVVGGLRQRRAKQQALTRAATERLERLRRERAAAERRLAEVRERQQRAEVEETELRLRVEAGIEACLALELEPDDAVAAAADPVNRPDLPTGTTVERRVADLERDLRLMGPVNPLALQELEELEERGQFLEKELDDVKSARRDLAKVVKAIDEEIVTVFAAAWADVSQNFEKLFCSLFPGGVGRLRLTTPDDLLNTGIEVEAKPSGKNVKSLSLLSGGERSLVALAFLFAVFRSRPSPFYLMDEVEAALDDINISRFLGLLDEFRSEAQLLVVSHQKRTMEAADCLYGVSMQPGGGSKVVSEQLRTTSTP